MRYITPPLFGGAIYLIATTHYVWGTLAALLGLVILTTHYATEIDLSKKVYQDYLFLLGMRLEKEEKRFKHIDRLIVTKGNYSQTLNSRISSRQMDWSDYTGKLITDSDVLDLLTHTDKRSLILGLAPFAEFLKVGIEDRTTTKFYWIDIDKARSAESARKT
jgi:hypothetical protein